MAGDERTEAASPRRRGEVRQRGQVARSAELTSAAVMLAGLLYFRYLGAGFYSQCEELLRVSIRQMSRQELTVTELNNLTIATAVWFVTTIGPFLGVLLVTAVVVNVAQVGFSFTLTPLMPDINRLNPLSGFTRLFSSHSLVELPKSLAKIGVVMLVIYDAVQGRSADLLQLSLVELRVGVPALVNLLFDVVLNTAEALFVLALADYAYQRYSFEKSIRMTKQEVKEESKSSEGSPEIKARIRQQQRAMARRRMMQEVPKASVVITNPTHLAIALRYDPNDGPAPRVVAKGERLVAQNIKRIAQEHGVPIYEDKPLARALYKAADIGMEIPIELYRAVAEVLAFVFSRLRTVPLPVGAERSAAGAAQE